MALGRPLLRRPLGRAVVAPGAGPRAQGLPQPRPPRAARLRRPLARERARLARRDVRIGARARAARALGAAHRPRAGAGRRGLHDAGHRLRDPARRHAGAEGRRHAPRARRSRRSCARAAASCARAPTSSASCSRAGRATGVQLTGGERLHASRAVIASVTPTQLYGRLLRQDEAPAAAWESAAAVPLRPRGHADPPRARRAAAVGLARGRTARAHRDGARHAGPERRLARRQRGRARAAARRGDDRRRPAVHGRPEPGARRQVGALDPAAGAAAAARPAMRSARSTSATAPGARSCARPTPTASSPRLGTQIANLERATVKRVALSPADLEGLNCNLVGGDIYAGSCALDQNLLWRPTGQLPGHATALRRAVADRRLDASRPGPRGRLGLPRREAAADRTPRGGAEAPVRARRRPVLVLVRIALSEISTVAAPFAEDVAAYARGGLRRHRHLGVQAARGRRRRERPSRCARAASASPTACPRSPPSCQLAQPGMEGPADPAERSRGAVREHGPPGALRAGLDRAASRAPWAIAPRPRRARSCVDGLRAGRPPRHAPPACGSGSSRRTSRSRT